MTVPIDSTLAARPARRRFSRIGAALGLAVIAGLALAFWVNRTRNEWHTFVSAPESQSHVALAVDYPSGWQADSEPFPQALQLSGCIVTLKRQPLPPWLLWIRTHLLRQQEIADNETMTFMMMAGPSFLPPGGFGVSSGAPGGGGGAGSGAANGGANTFVAGGAAALSNIAGARFGKKHPLGQMMEMDFPMMGNGMIALPGGQTTNIQAVSMHMAMIFTQQHYNGKSMMVMIQSIMPPADYTRNRKAIDEMIQRVHIVSAPAHP
jgi:hypothetical protein